MEKSSSIDSDDLILKTNPSAENPTFDFDSYEDSNTALTTQIVGDTIRQNIVFQMKRLSWNLNVKLLEDIENSKTGLENCDKILKKMKKIEKNTVLLWCAFLQKNEMVEKFVESGANPNYCDENGYTPLHMSAFSGCLKITNFLLSRGANPKIYTKASSPLHYAAFGCAPDTAKLLINNDAIVDERRVTVEETLLQSAVRCNAVKCLELFIEHGADANQLGSKGTNAIHLAADLGHDKCLEVLLKSPKANPNVSSIKKSRNTTALHLAAEEGSVNCIKLLIKRNADANARDYRGSTPLHKACKVANVDCVNMLINLGSANVNAVDNDNRTPLHSAIGRSDCNLDVIELLVRRRANINARDKYGFSPLHLAALDGLSDCVEFLIHLGANVTTKSKKGITALNVISRKTPTSLDMIIQKLDQAISLSVPDHSYQEVEMKLDFRNIIAHCHPFESRYLQAFIDDGKKEILEHPLCQAFLFLKWNKVKSMYFNRILIYTVKVLILTTFVLTVFNCNIGKSADAMLANKTDNQMGSEQKSLNHTEMCAEDTWSHYFAANDHLGYKFLYWFLFLITLSEIYTKLYGTLAFSSMKLYFKEVQNISEWFEIILFIILLIVSHFDISNHYPIGAFAVLLGWYNLMFLVGQLPEFGAQVEMYNRITKEFFKLFVTFSFVLIGFTISFSIIFHNDKNFKNPFMGFIKILVMMTGEQDLDPIKEVTENTDLPIPIRGVSQFLFVLFLFMITIVLMNLLVGIAVNDISALKKTAELSKLVRQTKLIHYIESIMITEWFRFWPKSCSNWMRKFFARLLLISPTGYKVVLIVRPLNPSETRLPRDVLMSAYNLIQMKDKNEISYSYFETPRDPDSIESESILDTDVEEQGELKKIVLESKEKIESLSSEIQELKSLILQLRKDQA